MCLKAHTSNYTPPAKPTISQLNDLCDHECMCVANFVLCTYIKLMKIIASGLNRQLLHLHTELFGAALLVLKDYLLLILVVCSTATLPGKWEASTDWKIYYM